MYKPPVRYTSTTVKYVCGLEQAPATSRAGFYCYNTLLYSSIGGSKGMGTFTINELNALACSFGAAATERHHNGVAASSANAVAGPSDGLAVGAGRCGLAVNNGCAIPFVALFNVELTASQRADFSGPVMRDYIATLAGL